MIVDRWCTVYVSTTRRRVASAPLWTLPRRNSTRRRVELSCPAINPALVSRSLKTAKHRITQTTPRDSPGNLVFWRQNLLVKFALKVTHPPFKHNSTISTNICSQRLNRESWRKRSISTNRKSTTRFPTSHRWTVYVTPKPPKGSTKCDFAIFSSKFQLLSKKVCYKVSLCDHFQRQSCSYIIPL